MSRKTTATSQSRSLFPVFCFLFFFFLLFLRTLLEPGFYVTQDAEWYAIRLTAVYQTLRTGQFPVRWTPRLNHEYGYPVMNFNYPFPFYAAVPIYAVTKDAAFSLEIIMAMSVVSASAGMLIFLWTLGRWEALLGTTLYAFSPYMAYDLYQRGSLGELVAMGIAPWVFWALKKRYWPLASLFIALLITSHNVMAFLFFPLILLFCFLQLFVKYSVLYPFAVRSIFTIVLALGLSSFFWFPALAELKFVRISRFPVSDFRREYLTTSEVIRRAGIPAIVFTVGAPLFLSTDISDKFWKAFPMLQIIQFPWRILAPITFLAATVGVFLIRKVPNSLNKRLIVCFIAILSFLSSYPLLTPQGVLRRPQFFYETNDDSSTIRQEYTPIWVTKLPTTRPLVPTQHYYPGWRAFDGVKPILWLEPELTNGELKVSSQYQDSSVRFIWGETFSRTVVNLISTISFLILLSWYQKSDLMR